MVTDMKKINISRPLIIALTAAAALIIIRAACCYALSTNFDTNPTGADEEKKMYEEKSMEMDSYEGAKQGEHPRMKTAASKSTVSKSHKKSDVGTILIGDKLIISSLPKSTRSVIEFDGKSIKDVAGKKLATNEEIRKTVEGQAGISLVAMWYFFVWK